MNVLAKVFHFLLLRKVIDRGSRAEIRLQNVTVPFVYQLRNHAFGIILVPEEHSFRLTAFYAERHLSLIQAMGAKCAFENPVFFSIKVQCTVRACIHAYAATITKILMDLHDTVFTLADCL